MIEEYLRQIRNLVRTNNYTEYTFRTPFENLLNNFNNENNFNLRILQEPERENFGAPDFKITDNVNNVIGYIECKNIDENINNLRNTSQIDKYLSISKNLIITNYVDFILYKNNGEYIETCSISTLNDLRNNRNIVCPGQA